MEPDTEGGSRPVPDPTVLTTEQLRREIDTVYARMTNRLAYQRDLSDSRMDAMDAATTLRLDAINKIPADIEQRISHLKDLHGEKFHTIDLRFDERDVRTQQAAETSQKALDAALLAAAALVSQQNEANAAAAAKAELSFTKQIDQIVVLVQSQSEAKDVRIDEIKARLDRGEGTTSGARDTRYENREERGEQRAGSSLLVAVFGTFLVALSLGVGVAALFMGK